ncbi:MAG: hypothetical protein ACI82H_001364 [Alphaproteobacteria bacterium]|jgi:hypothetical protein
MGALVMDQGWRSGRKALATLLAAARDNLAATHGRHARTKTMAALADKL